MKMREHENDEVRTYEVFVEVKMERTVEVQAEGITEAEEMVMEMYNEDEIVFTNSDAKVISFTAQERSSRFNSG